MSQYICLTRNPHIKDENIKLAKYVTMRTLLAGKYDDVSQVSVAYESILLDIHDSLQ